MHRLYACRKFFQSLLVLSDSSDRVSSMLENSDFVLGQEPVHFKNKLKYKQKYYTICTQKRFIKQRNKMFVFATQTLGNTVNNLLPLDHS